jgi:dihydrofolate reductase
VLGIQKTVETGNAVDWDCVMGNISLWMQISIDGFVEGLDDKIHWPIVDEELYESVLNDLYEADLFMYGRKTYELMTSFWPTADSHPVFSEFYAEFARCWKATPKLVISRTLHRADWNTKIINDIGAVRALRAQQGCKILLFGGAETATALMKSDLIDQYRLFIHPLLLGRGCRCSQLMATRPVCAPSTSVLDSAVVQVRYERADSAPSQPELLIQAIYFSVNVTMTGVLDRGHLPAHDGAGEAVDDQHTITDLAELFTISRPTVYRTLQCGPRRPVRG